MPDHSDTITRLYQGLGTRDHALMARCYAPDATFGDPVFPDLRGAQVGAMWRMLCERATDLRVEVADIHASDGAGRAHWEAWYTYGGTGRKVHNVIDATFELRDGLIVRHRDRFDLYAWARQALGLKGLLLGWAPPVQGAIRAQAAAALARATARHAAG